MTPDPDLVLVEAVRRLVSDGGGCSLDVLRYRGRRCPVLAPLADDEFARVARRAAGLGLVMRQDTPSGVLYWTPHPSKALGSPLDADVERFRAEQRERHPADLPGQLSLFGEGC